jgi:hypothetical protein
MLYRIDPPETTPEYDEWEDAQDEKKTLLDKYFKTLESVDIEPSNADEISEYYDKLVSVMCDLRKIKEQVCNLEDDFPADSEPDADCDFPDSVWEGDR